MVMHGIRKIYHRSRSLKKWLSLGAVTGQSRSNKLKLSMFYLGLWSFKFDRLSIGSDHYLMDALIRQMTEYETIDVFESECFKIRIARAKEASPLLLDFCNDGYLEVSDFLRFSKKECDLFTQRSLLENAHNAQVPIASNAVGIPNPNYNYWSFAFRPWQEEFIHRILSNKKLKMILKDRLGPEIPILYSINTMISFASSQKSHVTNYHRDHDSEDFITLFVYWTDVDENNGATAIVPRSHIDPAANCSELYLKGKAGSVWLLDTFALHKGNEQLKEPRVVTWIRFSTKIGAACFTNGDFGRLADYRTLQNNAGWFS